MQQREINKLRQVFYDKLKSHYSSRKYKEAITLGCAERCLMEQGFREDTLSPDENTCLQNCFHKYYRYLAYSNSLYSYLISEGGSADDYVDFGDDEKLDERALYE